MRRLTDRRIRKLLRDHKIPVSRSILRNTYGPAHELAHALVAPRSRRWLCGFGLDCVQRCPAWTNRSHWFYAPPDCTPRVGYKHALHEERAAFLLTQWLLRRSRIRPKQVLRDHASGTDEDTLFVGRAPWRRARRDLERKGLHRNMTIREIEARLRA